MGATAPQRCELFVNYFAVYLTGRSSGRCGFFIGRFLQHALALAFVILAHQNCRLTVVSLNSFLITVKPRLFAV